VVRGRRDRTAEEIARLEAEGRRPVWRFAVPLPGQTVIEDLVRGTVTFDHEAIEDFVVARSDSTPTYNLAAAVDDLQMGVSHVMRGEDHISNTPKQMLVIRALGGVPPVYAHIPLILGPDRKRLSKRHGAASVEDLERDGFLPQPVRNALALLGWSYDGSTTTFSTQELVERFGVSRLQRSPAVFDLRKLEVMNGRHLRMMPPEEFADALVDYHRKSGYLAERGEGAEELMRRSAPLVKRKLSRLSEYDALAGWLYLPDVEMQPEAWEVLRADVKHAIQAIGGALGRLETVPEWTTQAIKDVLQDQLHIMGETAREFLEPQRIALTGRTVSTGLYESLEIVGREEAVRRYRDALGRLAELWVA
jgi:glutamyl-tRNA synthetase